MIEAQAFLEPARRLGYRWYAGVPCSFLTPFIDYVIDDPALTYVSAPNEGDAVAAAAGAWIGGAPAVVMMQNSGLGNAVNPLASLAYPFRIPALLIITLRGAPDVGDEPQHELMGRITGGLLDIMGIPWEFFPHEPSGVEPALARAAAHLRQEERPYALVMRKGAVAAHRRETAGAAPASAAVRAPVERVEASGERLSRRSALARIVGRTAARDTVVVATTGYTGRELYALADRPNHLYVVGSMGCASALGLGLSVARPDLRVVVVDGDGAALMRMGNFAFIGACAGANLVHILLDNGVHDSTGGQATLSPHVRFADIARGCGYARTLEGEDLEVLDRALDEDGAGGPRFAHLRIRPGAEQPLPRPRLTPLQVRRRLMGHIARPCAEPPAEHRATS
ncbi:MAG: phosphonopyruvate decarboxylase [Gammaproteobacteria bacterium]|nr:phosphonopyruvate decarboxylase [Gammaproteobacteria bacterium]NIR83044.1 phosphonopyruvate decarboxylase [Gammaproteobacteria bacterium]NIR90706.1 phosphonopyruvate decarboxylase [Gammaproteobacteria bacterium]NIU04197.1 phosphonopyruvate decarboxylase [Gammaproteobacteria bacterium]NIV51489.1 phosphonopyruvate decarboxylase [Gammaproteobacteria bacterium]